MKHGVRHGLDSVCEMRDFIVEFSMSVSRWRGAGATRKVGWGGLVWGLPHSTLLSVVRGWGLAFSLICYYDGWTRAMSHIAIRHGKGMHMVVFGCVQPAVCTVRSLSGARFPASLHHSHTHI